MIIGYKRSIGSDFKLTHLYLEQPFTKLRIPSAVTLDSELSVIRGDPETVLLTC